MKFLASLVLKLRKYDATLAELVMTIPYLPISVRKVIVDLCQTGHDLQGHPRLRNALEPIFQKYGEFPIPDDPRPISHKRLRGLLLHLYNNNGSAIYRSLIWIVCRCAPELGPVESDEIVREGICKELLASQELFSWEPVNDYSILTFSANPLHPELGYSPAAHTLAIRFCSALSTCALELARRPLYPKVSRKKNVSQETAMLFNQFEDKRWVDVKTCDLERLYHAEGIKVGGRCELRWSWKYNDLKPRPYYCIGGKEYWPSRYIKQVAFSFMNACQMSKITRRANIEVQLLGIDPDDYLTCWDYSSFTTSLSELRHFLFYVARLLEDSRHLHDSFLQLFDMHEMDIVKVRIWDLLDDYNEQVNMFSDFSILRVLEELSMTDPEYSTSLVQINNGMLGVPGNIGFSTLLHGFHLQCAFQEKERDLGLCVGDDAFASTKEDPYQRLVPHMQRLGNIHPDKFEVFAPVRPGEIHLWKFMKRALERTHFGFSTGKLFDLPVFPLFEGEEQRNRTVLGGFERQTACEKMIYQISSLFWHLFQNPEWISDGDMVILHAYQELLYHKCPVGRLPSSGSFPFHKVHYASKTYTVKAVIPPMIGYMDFDPRKVDWAEFIWDTCSTRYFSLPLRVSNVIYPSSFRVGSTMEITEHPLLPFLEDFGYLSEGRVVKEWIDSQDEDNRRRFREFLRGHGEGGHLVKSYVVLKDVPEEFVDVIGLTMVDTVDTSSSIWEEQRQGNVKYFDDNTHNW